jgi:CRP/FNR family transcriptional regulator, cyclic AMP receptor protein
MPVRTSLDAELVMGILKTIPLFDSFTDKEKTGLLDKTNVYQYHKGEIIFLADERDQQIYIVIKGRLKVVETTQDGQERVMAFRHRGDYFGEMGLLDGKTDFATVVAMESCKILLISKSLFDEFFLNNNRALRKINEVLCGRLRECWIFHSIIGLNDAETKIRATLARYGTTLGVQNCNGVIINSILSHQAIADRVQISRETTSRVLKKMRDRHEIEITGRRIKLLPAFYREVSQSKLFINLAEKLGTH